MYIYIHVHTGEVKAVFFSMFRFWLPSCARGTQSKGLQNLIRRARCTLHCEVKFCRMLYVSICPQTGIYVHTNTQAHIGETRKHSETPGKVLSWNDALWTLFATTAKNLPVGSIARTGTYTALMSSTFHAPQRRSDCEKTCANLNYCPRTLNAQ